MGYMKTHLTICPTGGQMVKRPQENLNAIRKYLRETACPTGGQAKRKDVKGGSVRDINFKYLYSIMVYLNTARLLISFNITPWLLLGLILKESDYLIYLGFSRDNIHCVRHLVSYSLSV